MRTAVPVTCRQAVLHNPILQRMVIANILTEASIFGVICELIQGKTLKGKEVAKRVWIKFDEVDVDLLTRQQFKLKLKSESEFIDEKMYLSLF